MSLRNPSFGGVEFYTRNLTGKVGRRTVEHIYAFRDSYYDEDIGRAPKEFKVTACFLSLAAAQKMMAVCEKPGTHKFVHPWGQVQNMILRNPAQVNYPAAEDGEFTIELDLKESGENTYPTSSTDQFGVLSDALAWAQNVANGNFEGQWLQDINGWVDNAVQSFDAVCDALEAYMSPASRSMSLLDRLTSSAGHIIGRTGALVARAYGMVHSLTDGVSNPLSGVSWRGFFDHPNLRQSASLTAYNLTTGLQVPSHAQGRATYYAAGNTVGTVPTQNIGSTVAVGQKLLSSSTPAWCRPSNDPQAPPNMPPSLSNYLRQTELLARCAALPNIAFGDKTQVMSARARLLSDLDFELKNSTDAAMYQALQQVRQSVGAVCAELLPTAAQIRTLETRATLPAMCIVYNATGSINQVDDFVNRNQIKHPGMVSAGQYEVVQ